MKKHSFWDEELESPCCLNHFFEFYHPNIRWFSLFGMIQAHWLMTHMFQIGQTTRFCWPKSRPRTFWARVRRWRCYCTSWHTCATWIMVGTCGSNKNRHMIHRTCAGQEFMLLLRVTCTCSWRYLFRGSKVEASWIGFGPFWVCPKSHRFQISTCPSRGNDFSCSWS